MKCVAFSIKFAKTNQKFAENSEFCEKNSLIFLNYSLHSLVQPEEVAGRDAVDAAQVEHACARGSMPPGVFDSKFTTRGGEGREGSVFFSGNQPTYVFSN